MTPPTIAWIDTNVILRYLNQDHASLSQKAAEIIESDLQLLVTSAVLAECVYVLITVYAMPRTVVIDAVARFVQRANVLITHVDKSFAVESLLLCRDSGRVQVVDALLWAEAKTNGILDIYTFDRRFPSEDVTVHTRL
jgi:predicted nucleic acid-binding protein